MSNFGSEPTSPPVGAVTATARLVEGVERVRLNAAYVRALEAAGLVPVVVPPSASPESVLRVLDVVAGLSNGALAGSPNPLPALPGSAAPNCASR
jgi:gamma-glutamyl-gamma-aminobutyrate hydrolase PuuD